MEDKGLKRVSKSELSLNHKIALTMTICRILSGDILETRKPC